MSSHHIEQIKNSKFDEVPNSRNIIFLIIALSVNIFYLFVFPLLLNFNFTLVSFVALYFFIIPIHGSLIHEAIHGMLFSNSKINNLAGRVLCIHFANSYDKMAIGHVLHHEKSRTKYYCQEVYDSSRYGKLRANIKYYFDEFFGLYFRDFIFSTITCFLPKKIVFSVYKNKNIDGFYDTLITNVSSIRLEGILTIFILGLAIYLYGDLYWVFISMILIKSVVFSISAGLGHFDTPLNDIYFANNIRLPYFISRYIFMHFNYHGIHHSYPTLPWNLLPRRMEELKGKDRLGGFHISFLKAVLLKFYPPYPIDNFTNEIKPLTRKFKYFSNT